ncbi:MAG: DUF805 domain-containing protein [Hyphomicrobiales bacterium]
MADKEWYFADGDQQRGPYGRQQIDRLIADGVIRPDTLVWAAGMDNWAEMGATELASSMPPPSATPRVPPLGRDAQRPLAGDDPQMDNRRTYSGSYGADAGSPGAGGGTAVGGMDFKTAVVTCLKEKYATFTGRAMRSEYWYFVLFYLIVGVGLGFVDGMLFGFENEFQPLSTIFGLGMLVPSIAVGVRRLHDTDRTGWWLLVVFVPVIGFFVLLFFYVQKGTEGRNRFG